MFQTSNFSPGNLNQKNATSCLQAQFLRVDHDRARAHDVRPHIVSGRSNSIDWKWVASRRHSTASIHPRILQPAASSRTRYGRGCRQANIESSILGTQRNGELGNPWHLSVSSFEGNLRVRFPRYGLAKSPRRKHSGSRKYRVTHVVPTPCTFAQHRLRMHCESFENILYRSRSPNLCKVWLPTFVGKWDFGWVAATSAIDVPMLASTGVAR